MAGSLAGVLALVAVDAAGQPRVYRCVDSKGRVTYTQTGCDPTADQRRLGERVPAPAPPLSEQRAREHARTHPPDAPATAGPAVPIRRGADAERAAAPFPSQAPQPDRGVSEPPPAAVESVRGDRAAKTELEAPDFRSRRTQAR